jgi:hypothetical protein
MDMRDILFAVSAYELECKTLRSKMEKFEQAMQTVLGDIRHLRAELHRLQAGVLQVDASHVVLHSKMKSWQRWWNSWGKELLESMWCHRRNRASWTDFTRCHNQSCGNCKAQNLIHTQL